MARRRILAGLAGALLATGTLRPAEAEDKPHLTWVLAIAPPGHIWGKSTLRGYADETLDWFIARLPEFEHEVVVADSLRLEAMLAERDGVCGAAMFSSPERLGYTVFSRPVYWSSSPILVADAARAAEIDSRLNARGEVDLAGLLADPHLVGARSLGRSYSRGIDRTLNAAGPSARLLPLVRAHEMDMLANGRFDWTIDLPSHIAWWARGSAGARNELPAETTTAARAFKYITRPIAGEPAETISYIGCSNRALGRRAVEAVDRIIDAAGPNPPWTEYYLKWLDDDAKADWLRRHGQ